MGEKGTTPAVFAVLPGEPVRGHWHHVRFVRESELRERAGAGPDGGEARVLPLTDATLRDKFWVTRTWEVVSTSEVVRRLAAGVAVEGCTGPHGTEVEAESCIDAAWEAP